MEDTINMKKMLERFLVVILCITLLGCTEMTAFASSMDQDIEDSEDGGKDDSENEEKDETEEVSEPEIKILMIGNSFTKKSSQYGVGSILEELAKAGNKNLSVKTVAYGNAYLSYYAYWSNEYKGYYDETLAALKADQYDYIVLQDYTKSSIEKYESEMCPAVKQLCSYIYAYQTHARILLYETPSYSNGTTTLVDGKKQLLSLQEFQERTLYGYTRLQNELGLEMVPVGMTIYHSSVLYPNINMISSDEKHPSYAGYYLAATRFYYEIYGEKPAAEAEGLSYCDIDNSQIALLNNLIDYRIAINQESLTLAIGKSETLAAVKETTYASGEKILWKSLNPSIATVGVNTGKVTGIMEGTTAVIAETETGLMAVCCVTVKNTSTPQLSFGRQYYQAAIRDKIRLLPQIRDWRVDDTCIWSTSNASVATVSADGTVTTHKIGSAVIKVRSSNDSTISASYTLYVTGQTPLNLSAKISSRTSTGGKIKLSWSAVNGATKYRIYRYNSSTGTYVYIGSSKTNSYTTSVTKVNKNFYYKVSAMASNILTESELSTKVRIMVPKKVTAKVAKTKPSYIRLAWTRNSKATGYEIYRSTSRTTGYKKIKTITSNSRLYYFDKTVKKGKTYYYRIRAYKNDSGKTHYSLRSNIVKGKAASVKK